jgi:uncharacterized protein YutE (UPF0331/DUF86 family)
MIDKLLIREKLKSILRYIEESDSVSAMPFREFETDIKSLRLAERDLQLIVDAMVDVLNHILIERGGVPPESYYETFMEAGRRGVLPRQLARALAPSAGLRNRLVHEYEKIDLRKLHHALKHFLPLFRKFCRTIYTLM